MKVGIIGYGSAGQRHERILSSFDAEIAIVSRRNTPHLLLFNDTKSLIESFNPETIIIANESSSHILTLKELITHNFTGKIIVEKPLLSLLDIIPPHQFKQNLVYYNLRHHPVLQWVQEKIKNEKILSALFYVGQYLPTWRKMDYRQCYSSSKEKGGGVLRDLSHEIDASVFLFGNARKVVAKGGHLSQLEITSDDIYSLKLEMQNCPIVDIQMNYLDRNNSRFFIINTDQSTYRGDLLNSEVIVNGVAQKFNYDKDTTHHAFFKDFTNGKIDSFCNFDQGMHIVRIIDASERSSLNNQWISI